MKDLTIQKQLFKLIQAQIPQQNIADQIADILGIAKSGAYRRMTGETVLTLRELVILLERFSLSFDSLINPNATGFELPILSEPPRNMRDYLLGVEQELGFAARHSQALLYLADLDFFYYMYLPELAVFKFYIWSNIVWRVENKQAKPFNFSDYKHDKPLLSRIQNIANLYGQLPSLEIWRGNLFDMTLRQIRHCLSAGLFAQPEDALRLCGLLRETSQILQETVTSGRKRHTEGAARSAEIGVWYNEIFECNNSVIVDLGVTRYMYMTFDTPNIMISRHQRTFEHSVDYFKQMQRFGLPLVGVQERNQHLFFSRLSRKIDGFEGDITRLLEGTPY